MAEQQSGDKTLHQTILADIEGRITSGEWPAGHHIPFEVDLASHYGCSRMTVNKVMTQLAAAGLIERRRKSGSFVSQPKIQSAVLEIQDIEAEVRSLGLSYRFEAGKRSERAATIDDRRKLDVAAGARVVSVETTHFAGERPFCLEERLINLDAVPDARTVDFAAIPPGQWLIGQVPWSSAEHRITAEQANPLASQRLAIPRTIACLIVERRTFHAAATITHVRLTYPGDRHMLFARFAPPSGPPAERG